jgi:hypothetical protein
VDNLGAGLLGGLALIGKPAPHWQRQCGATLSAVFVRGTDNGLWQKTWNGSIWDNWLSLGGVLSSVPAVPPAAGHPGVFVLGTDSGLGYNGSALELVASLGGTWTASPGPVCPPTLPWAFIYERGTDQGLWQTSVARS